MENIPVLTGIRFAAALLVFVSHFPIPHAPKWLSTISEQGYAGVTIFFVLSGFILCVNYYDRFKADFLGSVPRFFVARFARIYPLYLLSIMTALVILHPPRPLLPSLLGIQAWSADPMQFLGINPPAWSVSVEFFLYATFPLLFLAFKDNKRVLLPIVGIVCCMLVLALYFTFSKAALLPTSDINSADRWLYRNPGTRIFDFALGVLGGIWYLKHKSARFGAAATYLALATMAAVLLWPAHYLSAFSFDFSFAVTGILLIVGLSLNQESALAKLLGTRPFVAFGESSYAFYLFHFPLGYWVLLHLGSLDDPIRFTGFLAALLVITFALHKLVEAPARGAVLAAYAFAKQSVFKPRTLS